MNPNKIARDEIKTARGLAGNPPRFAWHLDMIVPSDLKPRKTDIAGDRGIAMSLMNDLETVKGGAWW